MLIHAAKKRRLDDRGDPFSRHLCHPRGSYVSTAQLRREVEEYYACGATVRAGSTVVDVGANVGAFSLSVAQRCRGDTRLICIEPSESNYEALATNFRTNPLLAATTHTLLKAGLTSRDRAGRKTVLYNFGRFPTNSTVDVTAKYREFEMFFEDRGRRLRLSLEKLFSREVGGLLGSFLERLLSRLTKGAFAAKVWRYLMDVQEVPIRMLTLGDVLIDGGIERVDLLKIDVEGHEVEVLRGLDRDTWPRIQQVVIETQRLGGRFEAIMSMLNCHQLSAIRVAQVALDNGLQSVIVSAHR
jgi:FkbM family methyltransferase